jgi:hypothetical protein
VNIAIAYLDLGEFDGLDNLIRDSEVKAACESNTSQYAERVIFKSLDRREWCSGNSLFQVGETGLRIIFDLS